MFKDFQREIVKFFTTQKIIVFIILIVLAWGIITYSDSKSSILDNMDVGMDSTTWANKPAGPSKAPSGPTQPAMPGLAAGSSVSMSGPQNVANPADLLPKDKNSDWAALNPVNMNQGDILIPDLLQAGYHIGLDTIGQTLRNANLQLRSDPIISKQDIGPWNQSTIDPDYGRVPLEVGQGPQ